MEQNWYIAIFLVVWKKFASKFERENHKLSSDLRSCVISPFFFFFLMNKTLYKAQTQITVLQATDSIQINFNPLPQKTETA
jgi:hypothetical protein